MPRSRELLDGLLLVSRLVKLGGQRLADTLAEGFFNKAARVAAFTANEAFGLHAGLSGRRDSDLNGLGRHAAPPIWTVNLIDPSASDCSLIVCPRLRASIRAFSTA